MVADAVPGAKVLVGLVCLLYTSDVRVALVSVQPPQKGLFAVEVEAIRPELCEMCIRDRGCKATFAVCRTEDTEYKPSPLPFSPSPVLHLSLIHISQPSQNNVVLHPDIKNWNSPA